MKNSVGVRSQTLKRKFKIITRKTSFLLIVGIFFLVSCVPASKAATTDATLFFNPASTSQIVGADFNLVARVNPGSNTVQGINAVQLDITFDHAVLQLSSITAVSPFTVMGSATINNTSGTASVALFIPASQITTTSDVATLAFHAQANGANSPVAYASSADAAVNDGNGTLVVGTRTGATVTVSSATTTTNSSSHHSSKKKSSGRKISNSPKTVATGQILIQSGKKFSKNSSAALYFSRPNGTYYPPQIVRTTSTGSFSVAYRVTKPKGIYKWYAVNLKSGWKSKVITYTVK